MREYESLSTFLGIDDMVPKQARPGDHPVRGRARWAATALQVPGAGRDGDSEG